MKGSRHLLLALLPFLLPFIGVGLISAPVSAEDKPADDQSPSFVRLLRTEAGQPKALQTAVIRFARPSNPSAHVDLVGAIHVGDREYYQRLNGKFQRYEAVLYELVAPPADRVPDSEQGSSSPVSAMQVGIKNLLDLEFQLDCIDYTRPNLVHADLSPQEFAKSMADRGESFTQMFFRMLGQAMAQQSKDRGPSRDLQLLSAFFSRDRATQLKRLMADQFDETLATTTLLDGPEGSTIITVRNRRAMDVLAKQLDAGKKKIAVFYGAAHLPDMQQQLEERFGMKRVKTEWITAWDLAPPEKKEGSR